MAMKIDLTPPVAFVLMLPVGIQLSTELGLVALSPWLPLAAWAIAGLWLLARARVSLARDLRALAPQSVLYSPCTRCL